MSDEQKQNQPDSYGGITDPDCQRWLDALLAKLPPPPKEPVTK